jgi:MMP 1-O-methyltransferase
MTYKSFEDAYQATIGIVSGVTLDEARLLYELSNQVHQNKLGSVVEIGSYLGKSTIILAATGKVYAIDHHRGNSEHQIGQPRFRPNTLFNGEVFTYPRFLENLQKAGIAENVTPIVEHHQAAFSTLDSSAFPIGLLFVDSEHTYEAIRDVIRLWMPKINGFILFHDYCADFPGVMKAVNENIVGAPVYTVDSLVGYYLNSPSGG